MRVSGLVLCTLFFFTWLRLCIYNTLSQATWPKYYPATHSIHICSEAFRTSMLSHWGFPAISLIYAICLQHLNLTCCAVLQQINSEWEIYRWANCIGGREACPSEQASSLEVRVPVNACEVLSGENELVIVPFPHVQWVSEGGAVIVVVW